METFTSETAVINVQCPEMVIRQPSSAELVRGDFECRVEELAYLRSGDKGDTVNIGKEHSFVVSHSQCYMFLLPQRCGSSKS